MLLKNYQLGLGKAMSVRFTSQLARTRRCALSSREIRDRFCKYFAESHDHKFVRSSPVVPLCDPSVAFVNAGMNQVSVNNIWVWIIMEQILYVTILVAVQECVSRTENAAF